MLSSFRQEFSSALKQLGRFSNGFLTGKCALVLAILGFFALIDALPAWATSEVMSVDDKTQPSATVVHSMTFESSFIGFYVGLALAHPWGVVGKPHLRR